MTYRNEVAAREVLRHASLCYGTGTVSEVWAKDPRESDLQAAEDFLSLTMAKFGDRRRARKLLQEGDDETHYAKDLLRAAALDPLPLVSEHVQHHLDRIIEGKTLGIPLLILDDDLTHPLVIVDGYHRISAVWHIGENSLVPCRVARL